MSSGYIIVEVSRNNNIKTVSLDSSSHTFGWQVIQSIQDGGENTTASEDIILRTRNGVRLLPAKSLEALVKKKTKTSETKLFAQIMGEGGVKENGEQGVKVKRSFGHASSDSEHHLKDISRDQPETSKEKHRGESSQMFAPTENKKRKVQCVEAGDSSKHTFIKGSTGGQTSSKKSTRPTDSPGLKLTKDSPAKLQREDKPCPECGSTGKRRSTLQLGFKRDRGRIGGDQSSSHSKVSLTLSQRGCPACSSNLQEKLRLSDNECQKKEPRKMKTLGVAGTFFQSKVKQVSEKCTALKIQPSSTKESSRTSSDKSVEFKSKYFPKKSNEDSARSTNKTLEIKRKSAKSIKANASPEPVSECSSTQVWEISGPSLVESTDRSCGRPSSRVDESRKTSVEVVINTNSLLTEMSKNNGRWISTSNVVDDRKLASDVADGGISTSDDADVGISTSGVADCTVKSNHATKIPKDRKASSDINSRNVKKEGKKSTGKSEEQNADCSSTTDILNKAANSGRRKHKVVSTQEPVDEGKSTAKCVDIVAKQFEHSSYENGIRQKFNLINLQSVQRDPLDLVGNVVENGLVDGEQSFVDNLHDDEINSIHTEDCDSDEEPDRGTQSSAYIADGAVVINIGRNELRRSDLDTLQEGEWLNDCVINAYFILLGDASPLNVFSHSSFFFWSLYKRGYEGVQRWTKNVDLFAQDLIFIPVHNKSHWTLVAVHVKQGTIDYYNSSTFHDGYQHSVKHIQEYLKNEAVHRGKTEFCNFNWEMFVLDQIPRQQNSDDCGLFICQYAKKICLEQKMYFNAEKTNVLRQQMLHELLHEEIEKDEPKDGMS